MIESFMQNMQLPQMHQILKDDLYFYNIWNLGNTDNNTDHFGEALIESTHKDTHSGAEC